MATVIITNNHPRETIGGHELSAAERAEFDYIDWGSVERGEESAEFVRYKGQLYHLGDMELSNVPGWDQMVTETYFSAVLFRWLREDYGDGREPVINGDYVICGRCYA